MGASNCAALRFSKYRDGISRQVEKPWLRAQYESARKAVQKPCARCGQPIPTVKPSEMRGRKYCSNACSTKRPEKHAPCPICGKDRVTYKKTCSAACGYQFRKLRARKPKRCRQCKGEFWPQRQAYGFTSFCDRRCVIAYRAAHRTQFLQAECRRCGATFKRTAGALKRVVNRFCSTECSRAFNRGENSPLYRGEHDPNRGGHWRRLAEAIRKRDGHKCQRCNKTQAENKQKLSVDHIIPWRAFDDKVEANHPSNLTSLCRSCHTKKTAIAERQWLRGDRIAMEQYRRSIQLPQLFAAVGNIE